MGQESITIEGLEIEGIRNWEWVCDPDYGADADGNRGQKTYFLEQDDIDDLTVGGIALNKFPEEFQTLVQERVEQYKKETEPDIDCEQ